MSGDTVNDSKDEKQEIASQELTARKFSWQNLRSDSLDIESRKVSSHHAHATNIKDGMKWGVTLQLAFQSIGIVYGDIGTSPLFVYAGIFPDGIHNQDDILGAFAMIFYTFTLIPLIKYVFIVLQANDNGEGGTFALYSLLCRYAKVGLTPSEQGEDCDVSNFQVESPRPSKRLMRASRLKYMLENSQFAKFFLLITTMLGTSMVIGDGVLTPSYFSFISNGRHQGSYSCNDRSNNNSLINKCYLSNFLYLDRIVGVSVAILVCLFAVQRFGTDKVGYSFSPILCIWFALIGGIGVYNFFKFDPTVIKALNPVYIVDYFRRNKKQGWISLGSIILVTTAYIGQASFLRKHPDLVGDTFYKSTPGHLYWPMFVVALLSSIIGSQSMISGTFSIIQQSLALGCFPPVKIVHTSTKYKGQVYIPEVNYLLLLACVGVTLGFRTTAKINNAYGIAVVFVMALTSSLLVLVMIMIWKSNILVVISYVLIICSVELIYLSSVLYKFDQGGFLPLAFSALLMIIMYVWNNVYGRKYYYELEHKISPERIKEIAADTNFCRIPGLAMFHSELVHGIPPIFKHYVANVPALHSVLVFVSIKSLPISKVAPEERFLFRRIEVNELNVFRCVARYGYRDVRNKEEPFERILVEKLKVFIREDYWLSQTITNHAEVSEGNVEFIDAPIRRENEGEKDVRLVQEEEQKEAALEREIELVDGALCAGAVHLIGESELIAGKGAGIGKRILIDYAYNFLKKNLRQSDKVFDIPHERMLKVGMTYEL
ncbi:hypothetical protein Patl1_01050 [Pistacia atlantica]|uniref:Uncharacterized protein n=1 Tax=Pistacia atlantica TaxID=434234 RepID=A0ACC1C7D2_9ROSI|nr:hypothetical protein Patl1_01050 [Pistacia atlantica]